MTQHIYDAPFHFPFLASTLKEFKELCLRSLRMSVRHNVPANCRWTET